MDQYSILEFSLLINVVLGLLYLKDMIRARYPDRKRRRTYVRRNPLPFLAKSESPSDLSPLQEGERGIIGHYLSKNGGNKSKTSRDLGISINTLKAKIRRYDLEDSVPIDSVSEVGTGIRPGSVEPLRLVKR